MQTLRFTKAGRISSTHGLDGALTVVHTLSGKNTKDIFKKIPHIFVELRPGSYVPYFIKKYKTLSPEEVWLQLEEVDDVESARKLAGKQIWLDEALFQQINPQSISLSLVGYEITDSKLGKLGQLEDLYETPGQVLAAVMYKGKEVLIPLVDHTLKSIDHNRKAIYVELPEGLLEVFD
jgi:16S rRNA processing protein RimM